MVKKKIISPTVIRRLEGKLPPNQKFIKAPIVYDIVSDIPDWDMEKYRFKVWGEVQNPIEMTYDELLQSFKPVELLMDFHCVTKWSVPSMTWEGIQTKVIVKKVKPTDRAKWVTVHCLEDYTTTFPLSYLLEERFK
jgi:DMSO/TMAO reductase YedYZ molybdopterin-dependent catalytic subunit